MSILSSGCFAQRHGPQVGADSSSADAVGRRDELTSRLDNAGAGGRLFAPSMSALFFKRFLATAVSNRLDHTQFEGAGGTGGRARWISASRASSRNTARAKACTRARLRAGCAPDSQLLLFELDPAFSRDLERQFADDPRVHVINRRRRRLAGGAGAPRHPALRLHSFRHPVQHSRRSTRNGRSCKNATMRSRPAAASSFIR